MSPMDPAPFRLDPLDMQRTAASVRKRLFGVEGAATKFGRFTILGNAGAGAMGRVYVALDPKLDRRVALKLVNTESTTPQLTDVRRGRLLREARALARLSHPHVVQVFEAGTIEDQVYLVMELVDGVDLLAWLAERRRTTDEIVQVMIQAAEGLAAAHARGLVHRDFKPENVLVGRDGRAYVADFGLATDDASASDHTPRSTDSGVTAAGANPGTPAYMAPERHAGKVATAASDQYAFFVTLFEAVGERRPDSADDAAGLPVPRWLRRVIARGLAPEPKQRFADMQDVARALRRRRSHAGPLACAGLGVALAIALLEDTDPCAAAGSVIEDAWNTAIKAGIRDGFVRTRGAGGDDRAAQVIGAIDRYAQSWREMSVQSCRATHVARNQTEQELDLRGACLAKRRAHLQATIEVLADADEEVVVRALALTAALPDLSECADLESLRAPGSGAENDEYRALEEAVAQAQVFRTAARFSEAEAVLDDATARADTLGDVPVRAEIGLARARLHADRGEQQQALRGYESAYFIGLRCDASHVVVRAAARLAQQLLVSGELEASQQWLEHATSALEAAGSPPGPQLEVLRARAKIEAARDSEAAMVTLSEAIALAERTGSAARMVPVLQTDLSNVLFSAGDYEGARTNAESALDSFTDALGREHPDTGVSMFHLARISVRMGEHSRAESLLRELASVAERSLGADSQLAAAAHNGLANTLVEMGRYDEAAREGAIAVAIVERRLGPDHPEVGIALDALARIRQHQGRYEEGVAEATRALETLRQAVGQEHRAVGRTLEHLADLERLAGHPERAADHAREALAISQELRGDEHDETAIARLTLARALSALGQHDEARTHTMAALETQMRILGPTHAKVGQSQLALAELELEAGDPEAAHAWLRRADAIVPGASTDPAFQARLEQAWSRARAELGERASRLRENAAGVFP